MASLVEGMFVDGELHGLGRRYIVSSCHENWYYDYGEWTNNTFKGYGKRDYYNHRSNEHIKQVGIFDDTEYTHNLEPLTLP